jgi:hypothetical protein
MNSISLGKRKKISAVPCSFRLNIGFSLIFYLKNVISFSFYDALGKKENQFPTVPKVDRQTTSQAVALITD